MILFAVILILAVLFWIAPCIVMTLCLFFGHWEEAGTLDKAYYDPYRQEMTEAIAFLQALEPERISVTAPDGVLLSGRWFDRGSNRTVIFAHGFNASAYSNCCLQAVWFWEQGYNLLLTDQRAHGSSGGKATGFGLLEQHDLHSWMNWARTCAGTRQLVCYGVSMGSAAVALASVSHAQEAMDLMVLDCGFASLEDQMAAYAKNTPIPWNIMRPLVRLLVKLLLGCDTGATVYGALEKTRVPAFFFHGTADSVVGMDQCMTNYTRCRSPKDAFFAQGGEHTTAFAAGGPAAREQLAAFLKKYSAWVVLFMKSYAIIADATCDLEDVLCQKEDIQILPGHIHRKDGGDFLGYPRWEGQTAAEFYTELKRDPNGYTTAPPNVYEFEKAMEETLAAGRDALVMTISGGISGAYNFAVQARDNVLRRNPRGNIRVIDSRRFGPGFGLMVLYACAQRREGKSLEEAAAWLEENKNRFHQAGWLDDLSFVARKGRITHAKAFFGTLAGVKPIGEFDYNGLTTVLGKVKGAKAAYGALLHYMENTIQDPQSQTVIIAHTNRLKEAEEYRRLILEKFGVKDVLIKDVHPSCGINIGPGLMAAYYVGKPISQGLSYERNILESFISGGK